MAAPFVVLEEARRCRPAHRETYRLLRQLFRSLSRRVRGLDGEDPFALRRDPLTLVSHPKQPET